MASTADVVGYGPSVATGRTSMADERARILGCLDSSLESLQSALDSGGASGRQLDVMRYKGDVIRRLDLLRRLDWLETVASLTGSTTGKEVTEDSAAFELYHVVASRSPLDIALACVSCNGTDSTFSLNVLIVLLRLYPYSILPHIFHLLGALPVSCPAYQLVPILEVVLSFITDPREAEREAIVLRRDQDWLEGKVDVLREVLGVQTLQDPDARQVPLTDHALRASGTSRPPRVYDVEMFLRQRAMDMDAAGLIMDAVQLMRDVLQMLTRARGSDGSASEGKGWEGQLGAVDAFVAHMVLLWWARGMGVLVTGADELSLMGYIVMEARERMAMFLETCVLIGGTDEDLSELDVEDAGDGNGSIVQDKMWLLRHKHLQGFLQASGHDASMLSEILVEMSYVHMEWMLSFVRHESRDRDGPVVMGSVGALAGLCFDVLRHPPPADVKASDLQTVLTFQVLISEVAEGLVEREQALASELAGIKRAFKVSALMDELGASVMLDEACRMIEHSRDCVSLLSGLIEERHAEQMSSRGWTKLHRTYEQLVVELGLTDADAQPLFEAGCRCCLRLDHIHAAESFLEGVGPSKREGLVIACAHEVLESSESTKLAKKILGLVPDSDLARKDVVFLDTLSRLQSQGIDISFKEMKKSADTSQLFRSAICNATSTRGLRDVDEIVALSETLRTGLSRNDVLLLLAETSFALQDAALCDRACVELVQDADPQALPMVNKLIDSTEFLDSLENRNRFVSFALMRADGDRLLKLLAGLRGRDTVVNDAGYDVSSEEHRDERTAAVMVASTVFGQDVAVTWSALDSRDEFDVEPDQAFYVGAMCGIAMKVIVSSVQNANPSELLRMPLSALCQWACACLETNNESAEKYLDIVRRLGTSLVAAADEQRVSVINDKHAEDLWATGDVNAQRRVLMQMTDKIAAARVAQFGTISVSDDGAVGILDAERSESSETRSGNDDLADVVTLAHRCGTTYDDIEAALFHGILHRHGATEAFGNSWNTLSEKDPRRLLDILLQFIEDEDVFINNREVERTMAMIERVISAAVDKDGLLACSCRGTIEICRKFDRATHDSVPIGRLLYGVFDALRRAGSSPIDAGLGDGSSGLPEEADFGAHQQWCLEIVQPENALCMYELTAGLASLWPHASLVDPTSVLLSAWSKSGWSMSMLGGLEPELIVRLGASYVDICSPPDKDVLRGTLAMTASAHMEVDPMRQTLLRRFVWSSMQECQRIVSTSSLPEDTLESWVDAIVGVIEGTEEMSCIVDRLSSAAMMGLPYATVAHLAQSSIDLVNEARCMSEPQDGASISAPETIEEVYSSATRVCTNVLGGDSEKESMSVGEAVQSIFAIVQSLDGADHENLGAGGDAARGHLNEVRSLVYGTLKEYLSANTVSPADVLHSEVQIQLVEVMMGLGKQKWAGWESGDQNEDLQIPVYSRLVSHFSTAWSEALAGLEPTSFVTAGDAGRSLIDMARRADDSAKALALWRAVVDILRPHFGPGLGVSSKQSNRTGINEANETDQAFLEGVLAASMSVFTHAGVGSVLATLDDCTFILSGMPSPVWDKVKARLEEQNSSVLVDVLFGDEARRGAGEAGDDPAESAGSIESLVRLLEVEGGDEEPRPDLRVSTAIALTAMRKTSAIPARGVKSVCRSLCTDDELSRTVTCITSDGVSLPCPLRVLVFGHIVAQLVMDTEVPFARAAFVAFEFLCLERSLRVQDSAASAIHTVLAAVADVQASCDGKCSDESNEPGSGGLWEEMREVNILGKTRLAQIVQEAPALCAEALTKLRLT